MISTEQFKSKSNFQSVNLSVLHLVGSAVSDFYFQLSLVYAQEVVQPAGVKSYYAVVHPDGLWQLGYSLDNLGAKISLQEMIVQLPQVDVVVPHLFCVPGMTSYRAFFEDILGFSVVGARSDCTALAINKSHTRNIVSAVGVKVAKAQLLRQGETLTLQPPFVVKPNSEDNSLGVTLVQDSCQIETALKKGFKYDDTLLIEEYLPGRELRVGLIEREGELLVLPAIEYLLTQDNPIRTLDNKLATQSDGTLSRQPVNTVCPAKIDAALSKKLTSAVKKAHLALGYRDYSLYDFRVHAETHEPYMLESCSFWSFTNASVLSKMVMANEQKLEDVALELWANAAKRTRVACASMYRYINLAKNH